MSGQVNGIGAADGSFAPGFFGSGSPEGAQQGAAASGTDDLSSLIEQIVNLLGQLQEKLGGEEAAGPEGEEGATPAGEEGGTQASGGCGSPEGEEGAAEEPEQQANTQVLQAIQLLLQYLIGGSGNQASADMGPGETAEV